MDVGQQIYNELVEIQKENRAKRLKFFREQANDIKNEYLAQKNNFNTLSRQELIEIARPFFPPIPFQTLIEEGAFDV